MYIPHSPQEAEPAADKAAAAQLSLGPALLHRPHGSSLWQPYAWGPQLEHLILASLSGHVETSPCCNALEGPKRPGAQVREFTA